MFLEPRPDAVSEANCYEPGSMLSHNMKNDTRATVHKIAVTSGEISMVHGTVNLRVGRVALAKDLETIVPNQAGNFVIHVSISKAIISTAWTHATISQNLSPNLSLLDAGPGGSNLCFIRFTRNSMALVLASSLDKLVLGCKWDHFIQDSGPGALRSAAEQMAQSFNCPDSSLTFPGLRLITSG